MNGYSILGCSSSASIGSDQHRALITRVSPIVRVLHADGLMLIAPGAPFVELGGRAGKSPVVEAVLAGGKPIPVSAHALYPGMLLGRDDASVGYRLADGTVVMPKHAFRAIVYGGQVEYPAMSSMHGDDSVGHGGGHGGGGHGHGGGCGPGPWPWGYPAGYALQVPLVWDDGEDIETTAARSIPSDEAERIADLVAERLASRERIRAGGVDSSARLNGYEILGGCEAVGTYDAGASQRQMSALKQVSVGVAQTLFKGGQDAIDSARDIARETATRPALPGAAARDKVHWKLDWHRKELAKSTNPSAIYAPGDDLKKWVQEAFIEFNAAEAGREESECVAQRRWDAMWSAVGEAVASLPANVAEAVSSFPGRVVKSVTGIPLWAWGLGAAAAAGIVGYGAYRILLAAAPSAVPILAASYLPGTR